jgi:XTP/dITP diphosphohydrolase
VVLASGNPGKLAEFGSLLREWQCEVVPQRIFDVAEVAETGDSFIENALLKAHAAAHHSGLPALADDSGLVVDALDGAPGILSARFAGPQATDLDNNRKLLADLAGLHADQRSASFHCALVYLRHWQDPNPIICEASWQGQILEEPVGDNGFGYDPLFFVAEQRCSSAQLPPALKNRISHRGLAMRKLLAALRQEYS